ncbi:hypothetical protein LJC16_03645, partial [Bacteroidales bacterium OttesenSCG-928-C19]|nr:hypothetical protein [Bacteroidales bacterium OttesenSCG-928-C19]
YSLDTREVLFIPSLDKDIIIYPETYAEGVIGFREENKNYSSDGREGFMDIKGNIILLFTRGTKIKSGFKDGKASISNKYTWSIIDKQGNELESGETGLKWYSGREDKTDLNSDTWDALTDGMYGDYYGETDYDGFGF